MKALFNFTAFRGMLKKKDTLPKKYIPL